MAIITILVVLISTIIVVNGDAPVEAPPPPPSLPVIWGQNNENMSGAFRILSEVKLADEKQSYVLEEWADGARQMYRLDLVPLGDTSNSAHRKSLLVRGGAKSQERHFFQPFKCWQMETSALTGRELSASLADKFPQKEQHEFVLSGLGAIWLYALKTKRTKLKQEASSENVSDVKRRSMKQVLANMDKFQLLADAKFPYKIDLYFSSAGSRRPDNSIDANSLVAINLLDPATSKVKLSARIIEIDTLIGAASKITKQEDLFELPLGYGCERANSSGAIYRPPMSCYASQEHNEPRVCDLELVASLPARPSDDMDKWRTYTSSLRLASGLLHGRHYLTFERRDFVRASAKLEPEPEVATNSSATLLKARAPTLRRVKRVWDLGTGERANFRDTPMYYELTDHLRTCSMFRDAQLSQVAAFELPLTLPASEWASKSPEVANTRTVGLSLEPSQMEELFSSTQGFHVVREHVASWLKYRDLIQEKRLDSLQLIDQFGSVVWSGPVSLVRRFNLADEQPLKPEATNPDEPKAQVSAEALDIELDIHFLSQAQDEQLARLHVRLARPQPITRAHLHRELDIGPCLEEHNQNDNDQQDEDDEPLVSFGSEPASKSSSRYQLNFNLIFSPADDHNYQHLDSLDAPDEQIYEIFFDHLVSSSPTPLNLLQLSGVRVDVEPESVKISVELHEWPEVFNYNKKLGMRLAPQARTISTELKPSERDCAESCGHVSCALLVYCASSRICRLALDEAQRKQSAGKTARPPVFVLDHDSSCNVLERRLGSSAQLVHVRPVELYKRLRALVLEARGDDSSSCELAIELAGIKLMPSSIQLEDARLRQDELTAGEGQSSRLRDDPLDESRDFIRPDYEIVLSERKLVKSPEVGEFPLEEANHLSYGDCELLCAQEDCGAFSYCPMEKTCLVSQLHRHSALEANSQRQALCYVMARVYLSKFHKLTDQLVKPGELSQPEEPKPEVALVLRQVDSNRDCAIECMESPMDEFTCKSFVYCPESADCLLQVNYGLATNHLATIKETTSETCQLYRRSDLLDYVKWPARRLDATISRDQNFQFSIVLLLDIAADACASECSTRFASTCLAFHVCASGAQRLSCAVLLARNGNEQPANLTAVYQVKRQLWAGQLMSHESQCTAFVARGGLGSTSPLELANGDGEHSNLEPEGTNNAKASEQQGGGHFFTNMLLLLVGLGVGYALTHLLAMQNSRISTLILSLRQRQDGRRAETIA